MSVYGPFKEASEFSGIFRLIWVAGIPTDFYSQIWWELLFPRLEPRAEECGAMAPHIFRVASLATLSFLVLNHHAQVWD